MPTEKDLEQAQLVTRIVVPGLMKIVAETVDKRVTKSLKDVGLDPKGSIPPAFFGHLRTFVHSVETEKAVQKTLSSPSALVDSHIRVSDAAEKLVSAYRLMVSKHG